MRRKLKIYFGDRVTLCGSMSNQVKLQEDVELNADLDPDDGKLLVKLREIYLDHRILSN